ncbi:MAG: hypothetical protein ACRELY_31965 [Polyangiaceae bacterium]
MTVFFWIVWAVLTLLAYVASWIIGVAVYPDDTTSTRRLLVPFVCAPVLMLVSMETCAIFHRMDRAVLSPFSLLLFGAVAYAASRKAGKQALLRCAKMDALAPWRAVKSTWIDREPLSLAMIIALVIWGGAVLMCLYFRSWTFDPVWYHVTITDYAVQNHDLDWIPTHLHYVSGYPRNVELLDAWNCIFPMDNLLDDASQAPFAWLGMLAIVAWCRRIGASRALSLGMAAVWYLLPPVFLLTPTSYTDLACGALFVAAAFFASDSIGPASRWMAFLCMGLYVGSKFTGMFHLTLLAPLFLVRAGIELARIPSWRARWLRALDIVGSFGGFASVSLWKYWQNWVNARNPFFPIKTHVPFTHFTFDGPEDLRSLLQISPDANGNYYFFAAPEEFRHFVQAWLDPNVKYTPEVHGGGFGPVFLWFLLPCIFAVLFDSLRRKKSWEGVALFALFVAALGVPKAWWPRFAMGAPAACAIAFAALNKDVRPRLLRFALSLGLLWMTYTQTKLSITGWSDVYPSHVQEALRVTHVERACLHLGAHWSYEDCLENEFELKPGDVITYDESASFLSNYFTHDFHTRVEFVSSNGDPRLYVQKLRDLHVRWAGVRKNTAAEEELKAIGAKLVFQANGTDTVLYRMP